MEQFKDKSAGLLDFLTPDFSDIKIDLDNTFPESYEVNKYVNPENKVFDDAQKIEQSQKKKKQTQKPTGITETQELTETTAPKTEDIVEEKPEAPMEYSGPKNTWQTPQEYVVGFNVKVDCSLAALLYLRSLGYNSATWSLNEHHPEYDICDENVGMTISIDELIDTSKAHKVLKGYVHPPAGVWFASHPDCRCSWYCVPPADPSEIPDSAPGLPTFADAEIMEEYKYNLFQSLPVVSVTPHTQPPDFKFQQTAAINIIERYKFAELEEWEDSIYPVEITSTKFKEIELGLQHPIVSGDRGFQLQKSNKKRVRFYSYTYNKIIEVDSMDIKYLNLSQVNKELPEAGDFIEIDGEIGILNRVYEDNRVLCYFPAFETITILLNKNFKIMA